jgi:hypothetical protein
MVAGGMGAINVAPEIHRHSSFRKYYDWANQLNKEKY